MPRKKSDRYEGQTCPYTVGELHSIFSDSAKLDAFISEGHTLVHVLDALGNLLAYDCDHRRYQVGMNTEAFKPKKLTISNPLHEEDYELRELENGEWALCRQNELLYQGTPKDHVLRGATEGTHIRIDGIEAIVHRRPEIESAFNSLIRAYNEFFDTLKTDPELFSDQIHDLVEKAKHVKEGDLAKPV